MDPELDVLHDPLSLQNVALEVSDRFLKDNFLEYDRRLVEHPLLTGLTLHLFLHILVVSFDQVGCCLWVEWQVLLRPQRELIDVFILVTCKINEAGVLQKVDSVVVEAQVNQAVSGLYDECP